MKKTLTISDIIDALWNDKNAGWSYAGAVALAEYLDNWDAETGEETELDVVGIRCEFSEYGSALECIEDAGYGFEPDPEDDEDDQEQAALEWLHDQTMVVEFPGGVIIQDF